MMHGKYKSIQYGHIPAGYFQVGLLLTVAAIALDVFLKYRRLSKRDSNEATLTKGELAKRAVLSLHPSMLFWTVPGFAALIALQAWCNMKLYSGKAGPVTTCCSWALVSIVVPLITIGSTEWWPFLKPCILASIPRIGIHKQKDVNPAGEPRSRNFRLPNRHDFLRGTLNVVLILAVVILADCALELSWNENFHLLGLSFFAIEVALIGLAALVAYFLCLRHGGGVAIVAIACWVIGIAEYFVIKFKSASIQPSDLYALGTAAEVSSKYIYSINRHVLDSTSCALAAVALSSLLWKFNQPSHTMKEKITTPLSKVRAGRYLCSAAACLIALLCLVSIPNYKEDLLVEYEDWASATDVKTYGFLPSFVQIAQRSRIVMPNGYTDAKAKGLEKQYAAQYNKTFGAAGSRKAAVAQFSKTKPTVIAIMNESFSDLSIYDCIRNAGYNGPSFLKDGLTDALQKGTLNVSVQGGGTCNSEFEFLTGYSMGFVGSSHPYAVYHLNEVGGIVKQFKSMGYSTTAIHPNLATNWNRKNAYKALGFDKFMDIKSFPKDSPWLHNGITDAATYGMILNQLNTSKKPQFILDVTMQNHGGYDTGNTPADILTSYHVDGGDDASLNEYLSIINSSDNDLENFVSELKTINRPIVLVFFGDHQPFISVAYNDAYYKNEESLTHSTRAYQTVYAMWANYDVAGNDQVSSDVTLSASSLGTRLMYEIGAPLSAYQKAQLVCSNTVPQMSSLGYQDASGKWHELSDARGTEKRTINDLRMMFYLEFGSKV